MKADILTDLPKKVSSVGKKKDALLIEGKGTRTPYVNTKC